MIPTELRATPQWLVSAADKVPISPLTGRRADVRDRTGYVDFDVAVDYAQSRGMDIGFALTHEDPFVVIDLDTTDQPEHIERHKQILAAFDTYAELSRSGNGVHIWCRGQLARGARRDKVEVYPADRYMICTGRTIQDKPIQDCQPVLDSLFSEITRAHVNGGAVGVEETLTDSEVFELAINAVNADKFDRLCRGEWEGEYPSQSEADYALINFLTFYSRNDDQVKRLFRASALGKRPKAMRENYLDTMIQKVRGVPVEINLGKPRYTGMAVEKKTPEKPAGEGDFTYPPGFTGQIAKYIHDSSIRPAKEVAVASALGLMAGVVGRQFNISGTGLNLYLILLAKTGVGKEDGPRGIERIIKATREHVPVVDTFIGPGTFASGQAIIRTLDENPCFVSVLGEFGLTLQDLSDQNANQLARVLRRVLLDLYNKSGRTSVLYSTAYSDREKNTKIVAAPAMTLLGESTPDSFFAGLSQHHIADGLIPRFLIIEYDGDRRDRNSNAFGDPPDEMIRRFANLAEIVLRMQANNTWKEVELDEEAKKVLDAFDKECDDHIREGGNEVVRQLWNRGHLKALKVSGLLAVVDRPHEAVVMADEAEWAVQLVRKDMESVVTRFEKGDVGEGVSKQDADVERVIRDFYKRTYKELEVYGVTKEMREQGLIPYTYIARRCYGLSAFRKDKQGARKALEVTLKDLVDQQVISIVRVREGKALRNFYQLNGS
jgi:hypothetical protein